MNNSQEPNASMKISVTASTRATALVVVESCIFVLLNIATLVGNSLICFAFYRNLSLRTITNYFVLSLALTDLSMGILVIPSSAKSAIATNTNGRELGCLVTYFFAWILAGVSILTVMLLAINRYFRVVRPAMYRKLFTKKRSVTMIICAWVVPITQDTVVGLVTIKQPLKVTPIESVFSCNQFFQNAGSFKPYTIISIIFIVIPSLIIVACYSRIYQIIRQHNTAAAPSSQGGQSSYGVEEAKITRMLTAVIVAFYFSWLPPVINSTLLSLDLLGENTLNYWNFYHTFPFYASSVINFIVYATMSQPFRNEFLKIFRCQR